MNKVLVTIAPATDAFTRTYCPARKAFREQRAHGPPPPDVAMRWATGGTPSCRALAEIICTPLARDPLALPQRYAHGERGLKTNLSSCNCTREIKYCRLPNKLFVQNK